jgi:uncharacterized membrane protein YtjA (UPF0391 family)
MNDKAMLNTSLVFLGLALVSGIVGWATTGGMVSIIGQVSYLVCVVLFLVSVLIPVVRK